MGPDGLNAVHKVILSGSFNTLNLLMENGCNPNLPAKNGDLPITMVMKSSNLTSVETDDLEVGGQIPEDQSDNF